MITNRITITDSEAIRVGVDFSTEIDLEAKEHIEATNIRGTTGVKILHNTTKEDLTSGMLESGSIVIDGTTLSARIYGATAGERYIMCFFVATSTGNYLETKVLVICED